ncbi:glycerol-3-phosphate dehydrogenase/oxidase [Streptomyces sp. SID3343]|uniref:glycerol-3-phosphate dehydrogenase/oxidase n=1 Tax=Streptomyces sp. SID3343 TaxID=2690260 RepID=UPI00136F6E79|nr:glycerol-3-phosphate dehydrogenase/oxidase [Streptomyces sp. SID3343]MYW05258.1 FAD-dependent oxidoreductase [Streptomyces sp. SID3343]
MTRAQRTIVANQSAPVAFDRDAALTSMADAPLDVLIVGGGITGVSAALDAAARGLRVGLVERSDFASGTSSASSKMIHGGLRYIEQKQFRLVYHSLLERQRMYKRAPHLVSRLPFVFPIYREHGVFGPKFAKAFRAALATYDMLGGWRIGRMHRRISAAQTLTECPTLKPEGLLGGLLYFDCRTDDARLTVAVARTASLLGALVANHAEVVGISSAPGRHVVRMRVTDSAGTVHDREVTAAVILNAAGVWSDRVAGLADTAHRHRIRPAKGVHVVVPWEKVRSQSTLTFPLIGNARGKGGMGFVLRWGDHCYIGTTDSAYSGDLDNPRCTRAEAQTLLESLNAALTTDLSVSDVTATWAGLRPLIDTGGGDTSELSREHEVTVANGVVTVAGGKLTVARTMAQIAVDKVCAELGVRRACRTADLPLVGGAHFDAEAVESTGGRFGHLGGRYGSEARFVEDLIVADPAMGAPVMPGLPYVWAEVLFAVRHEMARTVTDVLKRRLPARFLDSSRAAEAATHVGSLLRAELGTPQAEIDRQVAHFEADVRAERELLGLA